MVDLSLYLSTYRKTSWDPMKSESLIEDDQYPIYNFDEITTTLCRSWRMGENLSSCDGLAINGDKIYLIEFKNQRMMNIDKKVLSKKAYDSLYLLMQALYPDKSIRELKNRVVLYVVHQQSDSKSFDKFKDKAASFAKERHPVDFGLAKYREFYSDVYTVGRAEFVKEHLRRIHADAKSF